eukprot:TRINITY_DN3340_c0_g1_i2.p1 TRINITY_DN3340_c0_g1~~TRINITY_DN3340_c0_g1_i2.p1  ORF type:complete len:306 (+),score=66.66 TRINITY_DN3340_c0_g1_i2:282-1199(+)
METFTFDIDSRILSGPLHLIQMEVNGVTDQNVLRFILEEMRTNDQMKALSFKNCKFLKTMDDRFTNFLSTNSKLQTLDLSECWISLEVARSIGDGLCANQCLRTIDISGCPSGDKLFTCLMQKLKNRKHMIGIKANDCGITANAVKLLCDLLKKNKMIKEISLSRNTIGDEGTMDLAEAITHNQWISSLSLQYCNIGPQGLKYLSSAVQDRRFTIDLSRNRWDAESYVIWKMISVKKRRVQVRGLGIALDSLKYPKGKQGSSRGMNRLQRVLLVVGVAVILLSWVLRWNQRSRDNIIQTDGFKNE